ncbi:40S ribosomal protein S15/S22 [Trachipleistophora hominis]|uniref:40S ribosomal protein S15/S22 n=1 Tax=Trachipleistophora hominis TaxID=72359 RepID=L7K077_TRAHO|nr:40S ribosomal protein S15/S22 [Trachipleistophora hominis]
MSDKLAQACTTINNANQNQARQVIIRNINSVVRNFLNIMQAYGYLDEITYINDHRVGKAVVSLNGRLNKCGAVCPRYDVQIGEIERYRQSILPARQFGHLIVSTSKGILDHRECIVKGTGGKVLGFFY